MSDINNEEKRKQNKKDVREIENKLRKEEEPLFKAEEAFIGLSEQEYSAEVELAEKYQSFVAEILRLSLLGIAVFGFLYKEIFKGLDPCGANLGFFLVKLPAALGVIMFGFSAASALFFRYMATEGLRYYIMAYRFSTLKANLKAQASLDVRQHKIEYCQFSKKYAAITLGAGGILIAFSFVAMLFSWSGSCGG